MPTTADEVLRVLEQSEDPLMPTREIADELPIKRRTVLQRLRVLEARGDVVAKDVAGRAVVWYLTDVEEWWRAEGREEAD